ncbi:MAG: GNAT family N-acetyltransferase [Actinobacteria bacterium]|nr:GNAT family N-acetyltransferase [Actinomycetota bacterium]
MKMISDFTRKSSHLNLRHSKIESDRFGLGVDRINVSNDCPATDNEIVEICAESKSDLLILRYPSNRTQMSQSLSQMRSRNAFHADTLVYFSKKLEELGEQHNPKDNWKFLIAKSNDESRIIDLARLVFRDYPNHYRSNRNLDSELILDGYLEWASIGLKDPNKLTAIIENNCLTAIAFALVAFDDDGAEIELNGVHPDFQNQGVYSALLESLMMQLASQKVEKLSISTQIQNTKVIKAWIKAGFTLDFSLNTFHLVSRQSV